MGMERRTEQLISWSKSQLRVFDNTHAERGTTSTMWLKLTKGKGNNAWRDKESTRIFNVSGLDGDQIQKLKNILTKGICKDD